MNDENLGNYYIVRSDDFVYNPRISVTAPVGPINRNRLGRNGVMSPLYTVFRTSNIEGRYNSIFKVQMPNITPHVCRHTYCTNQAKAGMSPKTLQYLMGHSEIGVTLNTYTHLGLEDAAEEIKRMQKLENARKEMHGEEKEKPLKQNMFKVV